MFFYRIKTKDVGWRSDFMVYAHLIPLICLSLDMLVNRIRMRFHHIVFMLMVTGVYFLEASNVGNYTQFHTGVYFDNLKFDCPQNYYFLFDNFPRSDGKVVYPPTLVINNKLMNGTCFDQFQKQYEQDLSCHQLTKFYCLTEETKNATVKANLEMHGYRPYNRWDNALFLTTAIVTLNILSFIICYVVHELKIGSSKPFPQNWSAFYKVPSEDKVQNDASSHHSDPLLSFDNSKKTQ